MSASRSRSWISLSPIKEKIAEVLSAVGAGAHSRPKSGADSFLSRRNSPRWFRLCVRSRRKLAEALQLALQERSHHRIAEHIGGVPLAQLQLVPQERSQDRIITEHFPRRVRERSVEWELNAESLAEHERQHDEQARSSWFRERFWPMRLCGDGRLGRMCLRRFRATLRTVSMSQPPCGAS